MQTVTDQVLKDFELEVLKQMGVNVCKVDDQATIAEKHIRSVHDYFGDSCRPGPWVSDEKTDTFLSKLHV